MEHISREKAWELEKLLTMTLEAMKATEDEIQANL